MTEESKAVQEVAKTGGKAIDLTEKVGRFFAMVVGKPSAQLATILEDQFRYYRYKNLLNISDKVDAIRIQRRSEGKAIPIPPRLALPILESASFEDDDVLQNLWARLIANSTDATQSELLHPGHVEVIRQMSSDEAVLLTAFRKGVLQMA